MSEKLISADALYEETLKSREDNPHSHSRDRMMHKHEHAHFLVMIDNAPAVDAVELNRKELGHLINDTIAYIWRLEDRGLDNSESGYGSRKALLEKLQRFEKEHFPEMACCFGERREENAVD